MEPPIDRETDSYRYIVGIDLGTTNSALAFVDREKPEPECRRIHCLDVPQLLMPGEMARRPVLPSFLYLPGPYELPPGSTALPWDAHRDYVVGEFAREQGTLVPGRLVSSAKSWLCHGGVDRTARILPRGAGSDVEKASPVEASARFLLHMREAWNDVMARGREGHRLEEQLVLLTVPASFDEVARELTVKAAHQAGLPHIILVEEPLAAFYAWISMHEADWQKEMRPGQLILVCDVGGGTTDFTIVAIGAGEKGLRFDRLAVGDHLMLGGDNMDLAIARHLETRLLGQPGQFDSRRWHQLWHQCRKAKEALLDDKAMAPGGGTPVYGPTGEAKAAPPGENRLFGPPPQERVMERSQEDSIDITIMGTGQRLIADTLKGTLTRSQVEDLILDGFFPFVSVDDTPRGGRRTGLTEWGLPYVQDPAITRHLAAFWQRFRILLRQETGRASLYPDFILCNGGALTPGSIRRRLLEVTRSWFREDAGEDWAPVELENPRPELAVAIGAAYYGLVRLGEGVRIGAGSPRTYYVQVAAPAGPAGDASLQTAVCLVPRGTEEGFEVVLDQPAFEVLANQPASFQLFSSSTRLGDRLGDVVALSEDEITALPPIRTVLRYGRKGTAQNLPVRLALRLTEVGTLELWCRSQQTPHRWQLQFDVRQESDIPSSSLPAAGETLDAGLIEEAQNKIKSVFTAAKASVTHPPERLAKDLVSTLDLGREKWPSPLLRKLSEALLECKQARLLTPQHEARWFNLLGFCLRPGFGDPLDDWRIKEAWKLYPQGLEFNRQAQNRSEWWIFWRRVAGGLTAGQQWHIYQQICPMLRLTEKKKKRPGKTTSRNLSGQEELEVWMFLANLERLPADTKVELGRALLESIRKSMPTAQELWALSRLGARAPFYGPLDQVIPGEEASQWLDQLTAMGMEPSEALARAMVQLARCTGDRERDLPQPKRDVLSHWLGQLPQGTRLRELLNNPETALMGQEKDWIFGEALPAGLILGIREDASA